jgi:hypothetical protein
MKISSKCNSCITRGRKISTLIAHKHVKHEKITVDFLSNFLGVSLKEFIGGGREGFSKDCLLMSTT